MNKAIIVGIVVLIAIIGVSAAVSMNDFKNINIEENQSAETKEPKHYSATLEDGIGITHDP